MQQLKSHNHNPIFIGIAGASGSGKSLIASTIVNELGSSRVQVIREDNYYKDLSHLAMTEREKVNYDHPEAFDHECLMRHITMLKENQPIETHIYDHTTHTRTDDQGIQIKPCDIVVLEGILLFAVPEIRRVLDIKIFMDTPLDLCLVRRAKLDITERGRSLDLIFARYLKTVRPMFFQYIYPSKEYADIIVPHGGKNRIAIDLIKAKIKYLLSAEGQSNES